MLKSKLRSTMNNTTTILFSAQLGISLTYITIELFGLCGNILVIFSICSSRRLKTNYYFLVFHTAICDIIMVLAGNLLFSDPLPGDSTLRTMILCRVTLPMCQCIFLCESLFLVIIALLRYKAVNDPLCPQLSRKKLTYIVASVYIIAFIFHVPSLVFDEATVFTACRSSMGQSKSIVLYNYIFESIVTFLPFTFLAVLYSKMCRSLLQHNKRIKQLFYSRVSGEEAATNTVLARNYKTLITSIVIVAQFFISVLPVRIIHILTVAGMKGNEYHAAWTLMLYFLGMCTVNPVIYGLGDKAMRASYVKCLKKLFVKK